MAITIGRRKFIAALGATAWPCIARAQQSDRMRRIGVLMGWSQSDAENQSWLATFVRGLAQFGWVDGGNVRIEQRWANADIDRARAFAKELVELRPDVILTSTTPATAAVRGETSTIPIVFAVVADPVGAGFVAGLPRPGGNLTGFLNIEEAMGGKWLGLLKEIAPGIKRAAMMFNPDTAPGGGNYYLRSFEAAARSLGVEPVSLRVHSDADIEAAISSLGREPAGIVMSDAFVTVHRATIISATTRNNVPALMDISVFTREGGLISYGPNVADIFRRAAGHVDRILRGAKPADLPVEAPIKFEMAINLRTAKAFGLTVPTTLLVAADELIE